MRRRTIRAACLLAKVAPIWVSVHAAVEWRLPGADADGLRAALRALA